MQKTKAFLDLPSRDGGWGKELWGVQRIMGNGIICVRAVVPAWTWGT